jgi:hypothetical protein
MLRPVVIPLVFALPLPGQVANLPIEHKAPVVHVNLRFRVGSKQEPPGYNGYAHLYWHLLERLLWMESTRFANFTKAVKQTTLDRQGDVVRNEIHGHDDETPGHPYQHDSAGSDEDLRAATLDDTIAFYERAELVGGKLAIWSGIDSGAEIELTVSAAVGYEKPPPGRQPASSESGA